MLLTIDIGNTNITMGLYQGKELGPRWRLATAYDHMPDEYGLQLLGLLEHVGHSADDIDGICLASVVPPIKSSRWPLLRQRGRMRLRPRPLLMPKL